MGSIGTEDEFVQMQSWALLPPAPQARTESSEIKDL